MYLGESASQHTSTSDAYGLLPYVIVDSINQRHKDMLTYKQKSRGGCILFERYKTRKESNLRLIQVEGIPNGFNVGVDHYPSRDS